MRRVARDILLLALATGISRVFGLVRDVAIADRFGAGAAYDAFLVAFFVPHFLRQLLAEGSLSTAFVPVYSGLRVSDEAGSSDADRFAGSLLSWLAVVFPLVVAAGVALAPIYVPFLASGFSPEKLALATRLTRILFPFIALVGFASVFMGILNAHHRFFAAALAPIWFNVGMILGVAVLARLLPGEPILGLAVGALVGGAGQLLAQIPPLARIGFRLRFRLWPIHPEIRRLLRLMAPALIALAVTQVNLLVDNKLASYLDDGGISSLQYAMRLFQLPLGVFAVSVATALLPRFSTSWAIGDRGRFSEHLGDGMVASAMVLLPATAGLVVIGGDVIRLLFEHGTFSAADSARTARVLAFYLIGLLPYGWIYVFSRAFYAMGRTVAPVVGSIVGVALNVSLDLALVGPMQAAGLALATGIAGLGTAAFLGVLLVSHMPRGGRLVRQLSATCVGTAGVFGLVAGVRAAIGDGPTALAVFVPMAAGILAYGLFVRFSPLWSLVGALRRGRDA